MTAQLHKDRVEEGIFTIFATFSKNVKYRNATFEPYPTSQLHFVIHTGSQNREPLLALTKPTTEPTCDTQSCRKQHRGIPTPHLSLR